MLMNNCNVSRDGSKYYCNMDILTEDNKSETMYAQRIFNLEQEITIVPKTTLPIIKKYGKDIIEMVKNKYPEDMISNDFFKFVDFLETIDED